MTVTINQVLQEIDELSLEDKEYVKENLDKMLNDDRREKLLLMSEEALEDYHAGRSKKGTAKDLFKALNG